MNQTENTQRLLGRILSQPASNEELVAVDAFGGTQIKTGETVGLDTGRYIDSIAGPISPNSPF